MIFYYCCIFFLKSALLGRRQFFANEIILKMMKIAFCFTSEDLFVLKIFKFLSWLFGHVAKRLNKKDKVNFKSYDVTTWLANNCNTHIAQSSGSKGNHAMKFGQLIDCNMRNIFLEKWYTTCGLETSPRSFSEQLKLIISLDQ